MSNQYTKIDQSNSLVARCPHLLGEWDESNAISPHDVSYGSKNKVVWKCKKCGQKWEASIGNRATKNSQCPYCSLSPKKAYEGNCLATINPELSKEWHPTKNGVLTPNDILPNSNKKVWWVCKNNHEWEDSPLHRNFSGRNCPYCSSQRLCQDNCLATINPELSKEWHPTKNGKLTPNDVFPNSNFKVWWLCKKCKHEWQSTVINRNQGNGCPACMGIHLKDGSYCASLPEAYIYLDLKLKGVYFEHNRTYPGLSLRYDFYIPSENKYIEVTGYYDRSYDPLINWDKYIQNIEYKRKFVEQTLGAKFEFVQLTLTKQQIKWVRQNMQA